jgi:hypothetical protein
MACPAGKFGAAGAATCTDCAAGTFSAASATVCTACTVGKTSVAGASACTDCAAGKGSTTGVCYDCSDKEGCKKCNTGAATCDECNAGYKLADDKSGKCSKSFSMILSIAASIFAVFFTFM